MPKARWGSGQEVLTEMDAREVDRAARAAYADRRMNEQRPSATVVRSRSIDRLPDSPPYPGMFPLRYPKDCAVCDDRMARNDFAGYDSDNEIVCEDCFTPYTDR